MQDRMRDNDLVVDDIQNTTRVLVESLTTLKDPLLSLEMHAEAGRPDALNIDRESIMMIDYAFFSTTVRRLNQSNGNAEDSLVRQRLQRWRRATLKPATLNSRARSPTRWMPC